MRKISIAIDYTGYVFLTLGTAKGARLFVEPEIIELVTAALSFQAESGRVNIAGYVVMPDHVHLLAAPAEWEVSRFVTNFKTFSGIKIKEKIADAEKIWRRRFYNAHVESRADFVKKLETIHLNPVRKKLCSAPGEYKWSSWSDYHTAGGSGVPVMVAPVKLSYANRSARIVYSLDTR